VSAVAEELARRMSPDYVKGRAKMMAREKTIEVRDKAIESRWLIPMLGGAAGVLIARAIGQKARDSIHHEMRSDIDVGYVPEYGATEVSSERGASFGERAEDVKERITHAAHNLRERGGELKEKIPSRAQVRSTAEQRPMIFALGALILGAVFGMLLPVTQKERQVLEPVKEKVKAMGEEAVENAKALARGVQEGMSESPQEAQESQEPLGQISQAEKPSVTSIAPESPYTTH
jgi:hypothetical protein